MKKNCLKKVITSTLMLMLVLQMTLASNKAEAINGMECCSWAGIHVYTDTSIVTLVSNYSHASQYGTCYVRIEEKKKLYKCQCGGSMYYEPYSKSETHLQPHG